MIGFFVAFIIPSVPGDEFILDSEQSTIDTGNNKIAFDDDKELGKMDVMPYGKYKGIKLVDLEIGYIKWAVDNMTNDKHMASVLRDEMDRRNRINNEDSIPF